MEITAETIECAVCGEHSGVLQGWSLFLAPTVQKRVVQCQSCHSYWLFPKPTNQEIMECYRGNYRDGFISKHKKNFLRGYSLGQQIKKNHSVPQVFLDVGCSIGSMMEGVAASSGWKTYGLEFDASARDLCASRGLNVCAGSIYSELPWDKGSFGYILANNVIEHETNPRFFISECARYLAPGGILNIITPHGAVDLEPTRRVSQWGAATTVSEGHLIFFSAVGLRRILEQNGFEVVAFRPFHLEMYLKKSFLWPGSLPKWQKRLLIQATQHGETRADKRETRPMGEILPVVPSYGGKFRQILSSLQKRLEGLLPLSMGADWEIIARKGN